jgi:hypothetical protein
MHTAETRVIAYHEKDYKYIVWKIEQFTFTDLAFQTRILGALNKPFWTLRSYTPVLSLARIQGENTKE